MNRCAILFAAALALAPVAALADESCQKAADITTHLNAGVVVLATLSEKQIPDVLHGFGVKEAGKIETTTALILKKDDKVGFIGFDKDGCLLGVFQVPASLAEGVLTTLNLIGGNGA